MTVSQMRKLARGLGKFKDQTGIDEGTRRVLISEIEDVLMATSAVLSSAKNLREFRELAQVVKVAEPVASKEKENGAKPGDTRVYEYTNDAMNSLGIPVNERIRKGERVLQRMSEHGNWMNVKPLVRVPKES